MGDKMTCPGCNSRTSSVLHAVDNDEACPYCGLPAAAILDVLAARERYAGQELAKAHEELLVRAARLEDENARLRNYLNDISESARKAFGT